MLVLSRKCDAEIFIGPDITIKVLEIHQRQVKLGIEAPRRFSVLRGELLPVTDRGKTSVEQRLLFVMKTVPMLREHGLKAIRQLVQRLGGTVDIDNRPGAGACIVVEISLLREAGYEQARIF